MPVWRFKSPHNLCRESAVRAFEPKPHRIDSLLLSFRFRSS